MRRKANIPSPKTEAKHRDLRGWMLTAVALKQQGKSNGEIAAEVGKSRQAVYDLITEALQCGVKI